MCNNFKNILFNYFDTPNIGGSMNGILIVDEPKCVTGRNVVNKVIKICNIKKLGHTKTFDTEEDIIKKEQFLKTKEEIINVLNGFKNVYHQEVFIYLAVKNVKNYTNM